MQFIKKNKSIIITITLFLFLLAILIKSAWIVDDAYISFRTVKNFVNGNGLTWNISQRVQAFTNPLYIFLMMPLFAISKNMYLSSILLSLALSMVAVIIVLYPKKNQSLIPVILCILVLSTSKAFVDYATSGLENPMTYLIIALFYKKFFTNKAPYDNKEFLKLCLIASLITINRIDAILLFIPPLCYGFFKKFNPKKILMGLIGFSPFVLWEIFSIIYYGFPFPNTAYAKLNLTTQKFTMLKNGFKYIISPNIYGDNITLIAIFVALAIGVFIAIYKTKQIKLLLTSLSIFTYLLYIMYIGGDFMVGRFLSGPLFLSIILIYNYYLMIQKKIDKSYVLSKPIAITIALGILFLGCIPETSTITSPLRYEKYHDYLRYTNPLDRPRDVRSFYYEDTGLSHYVGSMLREGYDADRAMHRWGIEAQSYEKNQVYVSGGIGFAGYFCPDETILIDQYALAEPLLARIPAPPNQYAAHNQRGIPNGYEQTLLTGENHIENNALSQYYDKLNIIVSRDVFAKGRMKTIINMNFGKYNYLIDEYTKSDEYKQSVKELGK